MKSLHQTFDFILSSPYLRCAQTACEAARELDIPVHFGLDLGEVFNFDVPGPQHRPPEVLEQALESMYPDVRLRRDSDGRLIIRGVQPTHAGSLLQARLRFGSKVEEAVRTASTYLTNVLVVTHADAVACVASFMQLSLMVTRVPSAAFVTGQRRVVLSNSTGKGLVDTAKAPAFGMTQQWNVALSIGMVAQTLPRTSEQKREDLRMMRRFREKVYPVASVFAMSFRSGDPDDGCQSSLFEVARSISVGEMDSVALSRAICDMGLPLDQMRVLTREPIDTRASPTLRLPILPDDVLDPLVSTSLDDSTHAQWVTNKHFEMFEGTISV